MPSNQRPIIAQAKFTYSPLGKAFEKQTKTIAVQGKKRTDAITNQNKKLAALTNKNDDHQDNYIKIFEELAKERFDKLKELTDETNQSDLIYYFNILLF